MFYTAACYFEIWFESANMKLAYRQYQAILALAGCLISLLVTMEWNLYAIALLLLACAYPYHQEEQFIKSFICYGTILFIAVVTIIIGNAYFISWYAKALCFLFVQGILQAIVLLVKQKQGKYAWYTIGALLSLWLLSVCFVWVKKVDVMHLEQMLPFLLYLFIILYDRYSYCAQKKHETMLTITNRRYLEKENKVQYERLQKDNDEILRQMHDLKKQLKVLADVQGTADTDLSKALLQHAQEITSLPRTGCSLLDRILHSYQNEILDLQIQLIIDVEPFAETSFDSVDLCAIFCNMLENAIESCTKCKKRVMQLKIRDEKGYLFIKMKNSCEAVRQVGDVMMSTKEDTFYHGFGLRNMRDIAHKYHGDLHCTFDREHQLFITAIHLTLPDVLKN